MLSERLSLLPYTWTTLAAMELKPDSPTVPITETPVKTATLETFGLTAAVAVTVLTILSPTTIQQQIVVIVSQASLWL